MAADMSQARPGPPLLSARMFKEYQYRPRPACLEGSQGKCSVCGASVEVRQVHRRVDKAGVRRESV